MEGLQEEGEDVLFFICFWERQNPLGKASPPGSAPHPSPAAGSSPSSPASPEPQKQKIRELFGLGGI